MAAPTTFHSFPKLPLEIRLQIWDLTMETRFVHIRWYPATRDFRSPTRIPALLHCNHESRVHGLKTYQLSFASSPEFARIYFSFKGVGEGDIASFQWDLLGTMLGRIGRKIGNEELAKIRYIIVPEHALLHHADDMMREWSRFTGLEGISVICDDENPESGTQFGMEEMSEFSEEIEGGGTEVWPEIVCLRDPQEELDGPCSRHWWFEGWNDRAAYGQKAKWPETMAKCLNMTKEGDDADFWLDMLLLRGAGLPLS